MQYTLPAIDVVAKFSTTTTTFCLIRTTYTKEILETYAKRKVPLHIEAGLRKTN